jgi:hypothetical protein
LLSAQKTCKRPAPDRGGAVRLRARAGSLTFLYSSSCSGLTRMTWHMRLPSFVRGSCGMGSSVDMAGTCFYTLSVERRMSVVVRICLHTADQQAHSYTVLESGVGTTWRRPRAGLGARPLLRTKMSQISWEKASTLALILVCACARLRRASRHVDTYVLDCNHKFTVPGVCLTD